MQQLEQALVSSVGFCPLGGKKKIVPYPSDMGLAFAGLELKDLWELLFKWSTFLAVLFYQGSLTCLVSLSLWVYGSKLLTNTDFPFALGQSQVMVVSF